MKRILLACLGILVVLALGLYIFREPIGARVVASLTEDMFVQEDNDTFDVGLNLGDTLPPIRAVYEGREISDLQQFRREKGLVVMINRSVDWCPFCMHQAADLGQVAQQFADAGLGIVMVSYDSPEEQQAFVDEHAIPYPLVSDVNAHTMIALKTLHADYASPEHEHYGLAYPGTFIVSPAGKVVAKWFLESYRVRIDADRLLADSLAALK